MDSYPFPFIPGRLGQYNFLPRTISTISPAIRNLTTPGLFPAGANIFQVGHMFDCSKPICLFPGTSIGTYVFQNPTQLLLYTGKIATGNITWIGRLGYGGLDKSIFQYLGFQYLVPASFSGPFEEKLFDKPPTCLLCMPQFFGAS